LRGVGAMGSRRAALGAIAVASLAAGAAAAAAMPRRVVVGPPGSGSSVLIDDEPAETDPTGAVRSIWTQQGVEPGRGGTGEGGAWDAGGVELASGGTMPPYFAPRGGSKFNYAIFPPEPEEPLPYGMSQEEAYEFFYSFFSDGGGNRTASRSLGPGGKEAPDIQYFTVVDADSLVLVVRAGGAGSGAEEVVLRTGDSGVVLPGTVFTWRNNGTRPALTTFAKVDPFLPGGAAPR